MLLPTEFAPSAVGLALVFGTDSLAIITIGAVITGLGTGMLLPSPPTWAVPTPTSGAGTLGWDWSSKAFTPMNDLLRVTRPDAI